MAENNAGDIGEDLKIVTKGQSCSDDTHKNDGIVSTPNSHSKYKCSSVDHNKCPSEPNDEVDLKRFTKGQSSSDDTVMDYDSTPTLEISKISSPSESNHEEYSMNATKGQTDSEDKDITKEQTDSEDEDAIKEQTDSEDDDEDVVFWKCHTTATMEVRRSNLSESNDSEHSMGASQIQTYVVPIKFKFVRRKIRKGPLSDYDEITPEEIRNLMNETVQKLQSSSRQIWDVQGSGSNYSETEEITAHSDYDYLLFPKRVQCRIKQCLKHPSYFQVFITNKRKLPLGFQELLGENNELLHPSRFKDYVFPLFSRILEEQKQLERLENKCTSPAFTVGQVGASKTQNKIDWVPSLRIQAPPYCCMQWKTRKLKDGEKWNFPIYVVPKSCPGDDTLWRISYSNVEKKIVGEKCSRKEKRIIQYLKLQLIKLKEAENTKKKNDWMLCSYHVTTNCLHYFERHPAENYEKYESYRQLAQAYLIEALEKKNIPHFFIKNANLLEEVDDEECRQFIEKLRQ